jgi:hypothetical protein
MALKDVMFWKKKEESFPSLENMPGAEPELPGMEPTMPGAEPELPGMQTGQEYPSTPIRTTFRAGNAQDNPEGFEAMKPRLEPARLETRQEYLAPKDMEIMSAKIENLRLSLEVVNQKLDNIERLLREKRTW